MGKEITIPREIVLASTSAIGGLIAIAIAKKAGTDKMPAFILGTLAGTITGALIESK